MTETKQSDDEAQHDGFTIESEVPFSTFVDFKYDEVGEYVHLIPDVENRELRCYRSIDPTGDGNRRIKTTIENVRFSYHWLEDEGELNGFYLTWTEAMTFMSFLDLLDHGRNGHVNLSWWEDSGKTMHEGNRIKDESLIFKFTKPNGTERTVQISSTWETLTHKMAKIEGEGFGQ